MLFYMQNMNFITYLFLKIFHSNGKYVNLSNLGMPGHILKMIVSVWRNLWCLFADKKSTSSFTFPLGYFRDIANLYFGYFEYSWLRTLKVILPTCRKFLCLPTSKKWNSSPYFSGDIAKIWKLLILGTLGMPRYTHLKS